MANTAGQLELQRKAAYRLRYRQSAACRVKNSCPGYDPVNTNGAMPIVDQSRKESTDDSMQSRYKILVRKPWTDMVA